MKQHTQQIINNIKEGKYQLEKAEEGEKDSSRKKRLKKLKKKMRKMKESTKKRMLLLFELEKELGDVYMKERSKKDKTTAW